MTNDRKVNASVSLISDAGDQATVENLPVSVIQAIYHEITGRAEGVSRTFSGDYLIDFESILQLSYQIRQFCEQFAIAGYSETISIVHYGTKERLSFSSMEKFKTYQSTIKDPTYQVSIVVTFLLSNPNYGKYQNYRIDIDLNSYKLMKDLGNLRHHYDRERPPIVLKIEYIDYTIGRSFVSLIEKWVDELDKVKISKMPKYFEYLDQVPESLSAITTLILFVGSIPLSFFLIRLFEYNNVNEMSHLIFASYIIIGTIGFFYLSAKMLSEFIEYKMWPRGTFCYTIINDGDRRNYELFQKKNSDTQRRYNFIIFGVLFVVILNLFSNYLYDLAKKIF